MGKTLSWLHFVFLGIGWHQIFSTVALKIIIAMRPTHENSLKALSTVCLE